MIMHIAHRARTHTEKGKNVKEISFFFYSAPCHLHPSSFLTAVHADEIRPVRHYRRPYNKKVHRHLFLAISYLDLCILEWLAGRPLAIKAEIKTLQNSGCYKSLTIQSSRFSFCYIARAHHQHIFIALIHNLWRPFSLIVCVTVTWFSFLFFLENFYLFLRLWG